MIFWNISKRNLELKPVKPTEDGMFTLNQVECLGACGYAPMLQVTNDKYVNNLTTEKVDKLVESLKEGKEPEYEKIGMPQRKNI
jgi:NADH:ubiquinone oxidoreductase subunit E